jgi:hypothetical protein
MDVRDKINQVTEEYKKLLIGADGDFAEDEQRAVYDKLDELHFWTNRLMVIGNDDL